MEEHTKLAMPGREGDNVKTLVKFGEIEALNKSAGEGCAT